MQKSADGYLSQVNTGRTVRHGFQSICMALSLLVILSVFWRLKLTGITMAGEAFCGGPEHVHGAECYENVPVCGEEDQDHTHGDACFESTLICTLEEHVHIPQCYSDLSADLETPAEWEGALEELVLTTSTAENILTIARSQLGMAESTRNFQADETGYRRGITRYGQWYGNPYGDWSAMFVCFCLEYAGVQEVPLNAGPEALRLAWDSAGLYAPADTVSPLIGQLLFLDKNGDGAADAVAIITGTEEKLLFAIEGDVPGNTPEDGADSVRNTLYQMDEPVILGYGLVPFAPGLMLQQNPEITIQAPSRTIWLDGTNGGIMSLGGSPNRSYTAEEGTQFTLPQEWQSPEKYSYVLRGWYDVVNSAYYPPGAQVKVTGNMVFYADWAAATYDIGQFNSQVANTVSTNDFVTVRMFDYGVLFNVLSERANVSFGNGSHTETWNLLTSGNNPYNGNPTLNYILRDWDRGSEDISYPNGTNDPNNPTEAGQVYRGLYTDTIRDLLFDPNSQVIGKQYLGEADHLFQLCLDTNHEHYGYYYYNSERNAASYNQSDQRFYVYEYLECTRTSYNSGDSKGKMADFLPLNSPYANTNGKRVNTYSYAGVEGEYNGTTHYMYDCRYNDSDNSTNNVHTNFWFGMSVEIDFYLPNKPGTTVPGGYGNQDIYGKDMHFQFSGDDDVWVFVDGKMVLDLGGLHGMETGDVNFATGVVTINDVVDQTLSNNLKSLAAGEHKLTLYYLERGSSMSNCAIYFNLAPRFSFNIQKEDVLSRNVLNGAQFSVFMDQACTVPAELWTSKEAHDRKEPSTNVFTVVDGTASMWGMGAGNVYYIKETKPPDDPKYAGLTNGIICLTFDKTGTASYNVEIIDEGNGISGGFTVHGFRIDTQTQQAYIVATNAPIWVQDITSIEVKKQWEDRINHDADSITVYLTVTQQDGTVLRLQEVTLSNDNDWYHKWENLPKYWEDGTLIRYGVEEAYIPGYYNKIELVDKYSTTTMVWQDTGTLENGKTYLFKTSDGYLSTTHRAEDTGFMWVDQATAESSALAQWTVTASGNTYRLTNGAGQIITFYYGNGSPTDFFAYTQQKNSSDNNYKQYLSYTATGNNIRLYFPRPNSNTRYYISSMMSNGKFDENTDSNRAIVFTPQTLVQTTVEQETTAGWAYLIANSPLEEETSLTVQKYWDYGHLEPGDLHEQAQVTVKLLADGRDTGRTVTLSLKNGWKDTFRGLPYKDSAGNIIAYTIVESWDNPDWVPEYGTVVSSSGSKPTYSTMLTNRYRWGMGGPELPSTGSPARMLYILCGGGIMLTSLVYGILSRRKRERRMK